MFQDVSSFERFQQTLPNPLLFSFKSTQKFSHRNLITVPEKKAYCPPWRCERADQSERAMAWKQTQHNNDAVIIIFDFFQ